MAHGVDTGGTGPTRARDANLVDALEQRSRMSGEHVGEPGREPTPDGDGHARRPRVLIEGPQLFDRVVLVVARRDGNPGRDRRRDHFVSDPCGQGTGDDGDIGRNRVARLVLDRVHRGSERLGDAAGPGHVAVRQQDRGEPGRVDELARGASADFAGAENRARPSWPVHRNSGPSSSRQPPSVAGSSPLPRRRAIAPIAPATPSTSSTRRNIFTAGSVSEPKTAVRGPGCPGRRARHDEGSGLERPGELSPVGRRINHSRDGREVIVAGGDAQGVDQRDGRLGHEPRRRPAVRPTRGVHQERVTKVDVPGFAGRELDRLRRRGERRVEAEHARVSERTQERGHVPVGAGHDSGRRVALRHVGQEAQQEQPAAHVSGS